MAFQTGIEVLDNTIGGLNPGVVLLAEEVGAGGREFALTTMMNITGMGDSEVHYVSILFDEDEIKRELHETFPEADPAWIQRVRMHSFVKEYFSRSIVPIHWITEDVSFDTLQSEKILEKLIDLFDGLGENAVVLLDSITDIIRKTRVFGKTELEWSDFIDFLAGVRKLVLKKNILLLCLLAKDVMEHSKLEELFNTVSGVFIFEWQEETGGMRRSMYVRKLPGAVSILEKERIERYDLYIHPMDGLMVSRVKRIA